MNFDLTEDQRAIRDAFARFVDDRVVPQAAALDEKHAFPRELFGELAGLGFFGMRYPENVGGSGAGLMEFSLALAEIARGSMSLAGAAAMQSLMGTKFLHMLGNADIVERLFKPALAGEKIGAICMTEPNAGSDLDGIATQAKQVDGGWLLNGQKTWITSAPLADFFTVFAKAREEKKMTIFLVERHFEGFAVGREIHKMPRTACCASSCSSTARRSSTRFPTSGITTAAPRRWASGRPGTRSSRTPIGSTT